MKTILSIFSLIVLMTCNSSGDKKQEAQTPNRNGETSPTAKNNNSLKQNGDYTTLFRRDEKDCDVLSTNEMASILNLEERNISANNEGHGYCRFEMLLKDGSKTKISIHPVSWDKKSIQHEIQSYREIEADFGKNNRQGYILISDTNDTYFAIRSSRGTLYMFNPNYDNTIEIQFGSTIEAATNKMTYTEEQKNERLDNAVTLANYLLNKYKK